MPGGVPKLVVAGRIQFALRFDLLAAHDIRLCVSQETQKSFPSAGNDAIHVPAYDFHLLPLLKLNYPYYIILLKD